MSDKEAANKALVREYLKELDRLRALPATLVTDDYVFRAAGLEPQDKSGAAQFTPAFFATIPDLMHPLDEIIAEGDTVAFRYHYEGTHTRSVMGEKPTGNTINYTGTAFMRVRDGKISEFIVTPDRTTFLQQLGILPVDLSTLISSQR